MKYTVVGTWNRMKPEHEKLHKTQHTAALLITACKSIDIFVSNYEWFLSLVYALLLVRPFTLAVYFKFLINISYMDSWRVFQNIFLH